MSGNDGLKSIDNAFRRTNLRGTLQEPAYAGVTSFLRRKYTRDLEGVDVAVTGIPFDSAVSNRPGTRFGPRAIRSESSQIAWDRPYHWDSDPLDTLAVVDYGDCDFDQGRPETIPGAIQDHIGEILQGGAATLTFGGDHYITYPVLRAHQEMHGPLSLIQFDAHTDTWKADDEAGRVDHGTMFYQAVKGGTVVPARSVQVGIRTVNDDPLGVNIIDAPEVHNSSLDDTIARIRKIVGGHKVYLTFDIDCLDPSFAPGTGTPVIGGLTPHQVQTIIRGLAGINLVGMDVVEVSPAYDTAGNTALAAATIAYDLLALYNARPKA